MVTTIFVLLIIYQLKHFIADYPLQGQYMLGKFKEGWDFLGPLTAHDGLHAVMTFCIAFYFTPVLVAVGLAGLDFVLHFTMDRLKAGPKYLGRFKTLTAKEYPTATNQQKLNNKFFWWALGLDQMVHHLTHYLIIYIIVIGYLI
jgi:hypothetical protein